MKAIVQDRYGLDALHVEQVEVPPVGDDEVLVRVRAACVNPGDVAAATGVPRIARLATGLRRPKERVRGMDLAGTVEAVGAKVTTLRVGDEVFGEGAGTFAELAVAPARQVVAKPVRLSFEEAAAVPMAGLVALQALRRSGVGPGQRVLVIGAGGGIGTFAVQLAHALGASVTGICSGSKAPLVRSLGADRVVDYEHEDVTADAARYDLILDNVSRLPLRKLRRLLAPRGLLLMNGGEFHHRWIGPMGRFIRGAVMSPFGPGRIGTFYSRPDEADLRELAALLDAGTIRPVVTRVCPLPELPAAIADVALGHAGGKIVAGLDGRGR